MAILHRLFLRPIYILLNIIGSQIAASFDASSLSNAFENVSKKAYEVNILVLGADYEEKPLNDDQIMSPLHGYQFTLQAAIQDLTYKNFILPNTKINLIPVNNWDTKYLGFENYSIINSGGYAAAAVYEAVTTKNVIAMVGDYYSATTRFSAGVASQLKLPFCGHSQASPALSDPRAYPYFFRMQIGKSNAMQLIPFLLYYDIKSISIVYSRTYLWVALNSVILETLEQNNIRLIADIPLSDSSAYQSTISLLLRHKSKVILTLLDEEEVYYFYYACARKGLVGHPYVWINFNILVLEFAIFKELNTSPAFSGLTSPFVEFTDDGEIKIATAFYVANETTFSVEMTDDQFGTTKFGRTNADGDRFIELRPPIFSDSKQSRERLFNGLTASFRHLIMANTCFRIW
ncbi:hypothetical protein HDU97_002439 [Phlyctochytrium planicorne]|nr:hypothetical protein HDU97_002439 [Phlyctochytrium planicorne]